MRKILNICSALFMMANVVVALWFYFGTKEIFVPLHWSSIGEMEGYGHTWLVLLLSGISLFIYALMVYCQRNAIINMPFRLVNISATRSLIKNLIAWLTFFITLAFLYVVAADSQILPLYNVVIYVLLLIILIIYAYYAKKIYEARR